MARRAEPAFWIVRGVNLLLCTAWEHGARHVALHRRPDGTEIRFLASDGCEHIEYSSMSYDVTVERLREMSKRLGRIRINLAGQHWHFDIVFPEAHRPEPVYLHMRPEEE